MERIERIEIENELKDVLVDGIGCNEKDIKPLSKLGDDLGTDSLDRVEIGMDLEQRYDTSIPDDILEPLNSDSSTFEDWVNMLEAHLNT